MQNFTLALLQQSVPLLAETVKLGVDEYQLYSNVSGAIAAHGVPGDPEWDALDKTVEDLKARLASEPGATS